MPVLDAQGFARKWQDSRLKERSGSQEHFTDLCRMLGHPTPAEADPRGEFFTFEKGATKQGGGDGWADVWYKGHFAWEYKGRHANLDAAYVQLLKYREDLESPPLLIVCDMDRFEVHCNFTGSAKRTYRFDLKALADGAPAQVVPPQVKTAPPAALQVLRWAFTQPDSLRPLEGRDTVTMAVAGAIGNVADQLRMRKVDPRKAARFLMKCLFCFFAEDVDLLPGKVFKSIIEKTRREPRLFARYARELFDAMARGGHVLLERIPHFDGGLFADSEVVELRDNEIEQLLVAAEMVWSSVEPAIFGTLFERCLDPDKHEQIGRHYTYAQDIADIVEPVLVAPLSAEWEALVERIGKIEAGGGDSRKVESTGAVASGVVGRSQGAGAGTGEPVVASQGGANHGTRAPQGKVDTLLRDFQRRLASVRVLDPACGSGNFLYMSLRRLLDLEKRVVNFAFRRGIRLDFQVRPTQLRGMEISDFAHELASVVVWIGYLQWMRDNGAPKLKEPILEPIETIHLMDAIVAWEGGGATDAAGAGAVTGGAGPGSGAVASGAVGRSHGAGAQTGGTVVASQGDANHGTRNNNNDRSNNNSNKDNNEGETPATHTDGTPATHPLGATHGRKPLLQPREPAWPEADFIVGNPPFLGGKKLRTDLGDAYVDALFKVYDGRVPREADLCCYWFEKARACIENESKKKHHVRAGLLATQGIRGGANRAVLKRIKETGDIFMAWSDRPWVLDGAAVRVSMIGFDDGSDKSRTLDGAPVAAINPDLSTLSDITTAKVLPENAGISFMGDTKVGPFDIDGELAREMLRQSNPHSKPNSNVVRPWANGLDVTRRPRDMWIVDFPPGMTEQEAALYEAPFEYINKHVRPFRKEAKSGDRTGVSWWIHQRPRPEMRQAIDSLPQYLVTPRIAKHRLFVWFSTDWLPDCQLIVFARSDDYFLGVLQCRFHEVWADAQGTQLREKESGRRYTPTTCFETFPFPWPANQPQPPPGMQAAHARVSAAAARLNELREGWLNPERGSIDAKERKRRTLTNLYNKRPTWLADAHAELDAAVAGAYGWPADIPDDEVLRRLLELNHSR